MGYFIFQRSRMVTSENSSVFAMGRRPMAIAVESAEVTIAVPPEPVLGSSWSLELQREGVSHAGSHAGHRAVAQHPRRWLVGYLRTCTRAPDTDASCCAAWGLGELQPFLISAHGAVFAAAHVKPDIGLAARSQQERISTP